ncbi:MAG TPA: hypothetical protein VG432_04165 [Gemmatimonadaceae bacterium]|nr:hypothetical protein [Gemmatimonadaceae bacterium]
MDLYTFSLALGGIGLGTMAVAGLGTHGHGEHGGGHHGAHPDGGGHVHAGHAHGVAHAAAHGHAAGAHHHDVADIRAVSVPGVGRSLSALVSPRLIFSFLVGFGAGGVLLRNTVGGVLLFIAALAVGVLFERLLVAPLWRLVHRFESSPALTLESTITDDARAVSSFDARGQGLVAIELDGQVVQVLGTLRSEDLQAGVRVRAGDRLRIEAVDDARNRCTVSYLGA